MNILRRSASRPVSRQTVLGVTMAALICLPSTAAARAADDGSNCKATAGYLYKSTGGHIYIGMGVRGADALSGKVYYTVSAIDITKKFRIDGTFWVYAYECRTWADLSNIPAERWSVAERSIASNDDDCSGNPVSYIQQPGYDPLYDPSFGGAGGCSDGSGGDDDPSGSDNGPEPTVWISNTGGTGSCHTEYITIEISYDAGETWSVIYAGEARVC